MGVTALGIWPCGNNVVIIPMPEYEARKGSIQVISEKSTYGVGVIRAAGNLVDPYALQELDVIVYPKATGFPYVLDSIEYIIMDAGEVLARLDTDD